MAWLEERAKQGGELSQATMEALRDRGLNEAERLIQVCAPAVGLPVESEALSALRKGDARKVSLAMLLRKRTTVGNSWIAERLAMGTSGSVSRLVGGAKAEPKMVEEVAKLEEMLK